MGERKQNIMTLTSKIQFKNMWEITFFCLSFSKLIYWSKVLLIFFSQLTFTTDSLSFKNLNGTMHLLYSE
jgi:hypothetical protein